MKLASGTAAFNNPANIINGRREINLKGFQKITECWCFGRTKYLNKYQIIVIKKKSD